MLAAFTANLPVSGHYSLSLNKPEKAWPPLFQKKPNPQQVSSTLHCRETPHLWFPLPSVRCAQSSGDTSCGHVSHGSLRRASHRVGALEDRPQLPFLNDAKCRGPIP